MSDLYTVERVQRFKESVFHQESKFELSLPQSQGSTGLQNTLSDNFFVREFCGSSNRNLQILEKNTGVILKQNADKVVLRGDDQATVKQALNIALRSSRFA